MHSRSHKGSGLAVAGTVLAFFGSYNGVNADALNTPAISGPLVANPDPVSFDAGPLGPVYVDGIASGLALWQDNRVPGDREWLADLSNGQLFAQKTSGWLQFYVQAGAYSLPSLGTAYLATRDTIADTFGAIPVAYLKLAPSGNFSLEAGKLPTLIGAEYTFTFENMNIERGLLWNQEQAISRGVQANYADGPFSVSLSWNDGFYSDRFNWLAGSVGYAVDSANSLTLVGGGTPGHTGYSGFATPLAQNNGSLYNLIYTWTSAPWTVTPYIQYTNVPADPAIGIARTASTAGGAVLVSYALNSGWKFAARAEYINASGGAAGPNLLYGPGSDAWSLTVTPTWQQGILFARGEASYVGVCGATAGYAFGPYRNKTSQARLMFETGVLF